MYIYTYESVCNIMYLNICLIKRLSVFNNFVFDLCNFGEKRLSSSRSPTLYSAFLYIAGDGR